MFWLVPPPGFRHAGSSERYYLDFTRPACQAVTSRGIRVVGASTLGHGYQGKAGPRDPNAATATSFRQWCHDTLKPAVQA